MNYIENLKESYTLDENDNIHRVNVMAEDDEGYYVVPVNQTRQKPKDEVFLDHRKAMYASFLAKLKRGDHRLGIPSKNSRLFKPDYDEVLNEVLDDYPELAL